MNRRRRDLLFAAIGVAAWAIASVALGANRMDWPDPRWVLKPGARPSDALSKPVSLAEGAKRGLVAVSPSPGGDVLTLKPVGAAYSVVWQEKLATPHRVQYDFRGLGTMTACVVSVDARKHWALDLGLLAIYANDKRQSQHPSGWYKATPSGEYDQRKWWRVTIENFQDFSRVKVAERDTGFLLADYEHVAHEPVSAADLELAKVGEKQALDIEFANVTVETGLAAATPSAPPSPPAGHRVHFFDAFCGQAAKWGSPRYLPGALTLPKKDYFTFAYPVFIPDLSFSDGVIEAEVLLPPNAHGEIRVRVNPFGDGYYAFQFGLGRAAQFVKSLNVAQASEPIGKSLGVRCRPGRWNRLRIQADGPQLSASIDGEPSATATDAAHATGEVCLVGSEAAPVTFGQLVLFAKEGVPGQRSQPPGGPNLFGGSPNKLGTPAAPTGRIAQGSLLDADGRTHRYVLRDDVLEYDGQPFVPVRDSDGQYFVLYEPARWPAKAWEKLRCADTLRDVARHGLTYPIVRLRLVDYVDCTRDDHGFHEDGAIGGRSRILRLGDDEYRVTSCRKTLPPYFVYTTAFESVGKPHVVAYQAPNDRERYLSVNPIPTESGSGGVHTGGNYPVDGKSHVQMHVYYPPQREVEWVFMHSINAARVRDRLDWSPESGAAVANVWVMELLDAPADARPVVHPPSGPRRHIGAHEQQTVFVFRNYGARVDKQKPTAEQRQAAFTRWLDYVRFAGGDLADLRWLGVDWMISGPGSQVAYPSKLFAEYRKGDENRVQELLPHVAARGMVSYPCLATFNLNDDEKPKFGLTDDDILVKKDGEPARIFGQTKLDPTSDKVKALFVRIVDELAEQTAANACVPGIGISIDGFFTLTDETGYGANTLRRYERDTGGKTPSAAAEAYDWLHAAPERLKHWQAWRCAEMRELLTRLRDAVRKRRPNLVLKVALMNKRTYEFLRMTDAEALDLLLGQGIDPALYRDDDGIFFAARSCYEHKPKNKDGTAGFNFTHGVADVPTRHGTGYHQWTGYWEQAGVFNCLSRYQIGWLASANLVPLGRRILETATYHLRVGNVRELQYQTWERGLAGWEHHLRRFAAAFRALPVAEPRPFKSKVAVLSGPPADETLWVSWHGDRLAVINDHAAPRVVRIEAAGGMMELGRSRKLRPSDGWIELELAPFDLLVLAAEKSAPK